MIQYCPLLIPSVELFKKDKPRLTMVRAGLFLPHTKTKFLCFLTFLINGPIGAIC